LTDIFGYTEGECYGVGVEKLLSKRGEILAIAGLHTTLKNLTFENNSSHKSYSV
jgi:hypothetical protein